MPAPHSIYRGIRKLVPGCYVNIVGRPESIEAPVRYWSLNEAAENGEKHRHRCSDADAVQMLEATLKNAVKQQMIADVPLGAFLSGGVDSSTIVALMQMQSPHPVRTFTIGFTEIAYNEALSAKAVAAHLGTKHTELYVSAEEAMGVLPRLPSIYDEPFSDSSQIPTYLVSRLAQTSVSVSLSGDGGDELFGGYSRYDSAAKWHRRLKSMPPAIRIGLGRLIASKRTYTKVAELLTRVLGNKAGASSRQQMHKLTRLLQSSPIEGIYREFVSHWRPEDKLVLNEYEHPSLLTESSSWPKLSDYESWMMCVDAQTYLPDEILTKLDRAAMSVSLESRLPMLDHRVVELACELPMTMKIRGGTRKWVLKELLAKYVPRSLTDRPKRGFAIPLSEWMRGEMREWIEAQICRNKINREGFLNSDAVENRWRRHLSGNTDESALIWHVVVFEAWLEQQKKI